MLMRNMNQSLGMCNGTRLIVTKLGKYVIEGKIISGSNIGEKVFIPRLSLTWRCLYSVHTNKISPLIGANQIEWSLRENWI
jgi:hypothetical protein